MSGSIALGICLGPEQATQVAPYYDYIELSFSTALNPLLDDATFEPQMARLRELPLPAQACNNFVAAQVKLVGPHVDRDQVHRYVERGFARAEQLGVERVEARPGRLILGGELLEARAQALHLDACLACLALQFGDTGRLVDLLDREDALFRRSRAGCGKPDGEREHHHDDARRPPCEARAADFGLDFHHPECIGPNCRLFTCRGASPAAHGDRVQKCSLPRRSPRPRATMQTADLVLR